MLKKELRTRDKMQGMHEPCKMKWLKPTFDTKATFLQCGALVLELTRLTAERRAARKTYEGHVHGTKRACTNAAPRDGTSGVTAAL